MARQRSHSIEFKRQVAQEFIAGESLYALSKRQPENERQRLSATVRPAEFLLLCNDGIQHSASSRRTAWKAGLPRPGQLALGRRLEVLRCTSAGYLNNGYALLIVTSLLFGAYHWWTGIGNIVEALSIGVFVDAVLPSISSALAGRACTLPHRYCRLRTMIASKRSPTADY
jgi:hypothetical protein